MFIKSFSIYTNANLISLNWEKTHFVHFTTKNNFFSNFDIIYKDKKLTAVYSIKFLALTLDNSLSWRKHTEAIVPKLSAATFAVRTVRSLLSLDSLKLIYYSYFHSILNYGIIFWGNTHYSNAIFKMQKRIIRIMVGIRNRDSVRSTLRSWKYCHYNPNICYHFCSLWLIMENILDWTLKFIVLILKINQICIHHLQNWRPSITYLPMWRTFSRLRNSSNEPWKKSYNFTPFIA